MFLNLVIKLHVDDCLMSVSDKNQAVDLVRDLTALCKSGGFHLAKWMSNNRTVLASIPESERVQIWTLSMMYYLKKESLE